MRRVHESYVAAGAELITTNTYTLNPFHVGHELFERDGRRLTALAASIAREVADSHPGVRVAGCLPPVLGSYRPDLFVREEARPILDVLILEQAPGRRPLVGGDTILDCRSRLRQGDARCPRAGCAALDLVHVARRARRRRAAPAIGRIGRRRRARGGTSRCRGAALQLQPAGGDGAGNRSGGGNDPTPDRRLRQRLRARPGAAANAGLHDIREDVTPERYLELARRWVAAGATVVGGCCGIGPEHISALSADLSDG